MSAVVNLSCIYCKQGFIGGTFQHPIIQDCRHFSFFMSSMKQNIVPCFAICGKQEVVNVNVTCKHCNKFINTLVDHPSDESYFEFIRCIWCQGCNCN